jgi:hypothetical protein
MAELVSCPWKSRIWALFHGSIARIRRMYLQFKCSLSRVQGGVQKIADRTGGRASAPLLLPPEGSLPSMNLRLRLPVLLIVIHHDLLDILKKSNL